ncbi:AAR102Cp [Eremothecium gossypii ATCC 10895]|uniref:AAR102Cp n=1 Tax=Eremothecium gossypii (strain ATCC 10895 / CBS 109.51 / FGSC 9923 / NRRL Y-1056) TaxID=284811 RepID=Q75EH7_EREGS|nr:AAR102Cp [Eremothecium gossypii ATCC 10895]AAS50467.1 AAR102Cp [Eremothecium gossypii ATCC 10895]AEY94753.1 FAAR102Cp [Eremothecium gossypii FDAG1]
MRKALSPLVSRNSHIARTMARGSDSASRKRTRQKTTEKNNVVDEEISGVSSNEEGSSSDEQELEDVADAELDSDEEFANENPADKRRRLAKQYLENIKEEANEIMHGDSEAHADDAQGQGFADAYNNFDARDLDRDIISARLKQDVAEQRGSVYRWIADKLLLSEAKKSFTRVGEKNLTALSCYQQAMNKFSHREIQSKSKGLMFAYTVSKDMQLTKYDITDFNARPTKVKYTKGGRKYIPEGNQGFQNTTEGHYDEILTVAASPDGKYVVTGGRDKKLIVWSTESLAPVKVIPTKDRRGEVLGLAFRRNTDQLYAACADYKIRTFAINQFSQLEVLYGHQDIVADISALNMERCVTVGSRDRTCMLWKIADETRLTFRGGDDPEKLLRRWQKANSEQENKDADDNTPAEPPVFYGEGSIDCITMLDDSHFISGSDNGNISLWSLSKKKPLFVQRVAHGVQPQPDNTKISGERDPAVRTQQAQGNRLAQPYWITALHAVPYSNVFFSGSWNGTMKVWKLHENMRSFEPLGELDGCKGLVTKIQTVEAGKSGRETLRVLASVSKEHRLGRWMGKLPGARNGLFSAVIDQAGF